MDSRARRLFQLVIVSAHYFAHYAARVCRTCCYFPWRSLPRDHSHRLDPPFPSQKKKSKSTTSEMQLFFFLFFLFFFNQEKQFVRGMTTVKIRTRSYNEFQLSKPANVRDCKNEQLRESEDALREIHFGDCFSEPLGAVNNFKSFRRFNFPHLWPLKAPPPWLEFSNFRALFSKRVSVCG